MKPVIPSDDSVAIVIDDEWLSVRQHFIQALSSPNGKIMTKDVIRTLHEVQRRERAKMEKNILQKYEHKILSYFADGTEVDPSRITPELKLIEKSDSIEGAVFRAATLLWSVPVSQGYGRRMRYLIIDKQNQKLIGIFALGDPVFNLKCRDTWIGWNVNQRRERLAFILDAYVLGAVPPYSFILGGKLIGSLLTAQEIQIAFRNRYSLLKGLISQTVKDSHLVLITTTSALGRSSIYNRLRLPNIVNFIKIGATDGWGHFLITDELFKQARILLRAHGDSYADNYKFGQGPSWRLRAIRKACSYLNVDEDLLRHGIQREVYAIPLVNNWREVLLGKEHLPNLGENLYDADSIGKMAIRRWVIPRANKTHDWFYWTRDDTWESMTKYVFDNKD